MAACLTTAALGPAACSGPADPDCPRPGAGAEHPQDYRAADVDGTDADTCRLIGAVVREGDLAATVPRAGESVTVTGTPESGPAPGRLTVTTDRVGRITISRGT